MRKMKDRGVEWIGEIPEEWGIKRFKYTVKNSTKRTEDNSNYIGLENVEAWSGRINLHHNESFEAEGGSLVVEAGDVLFGKLR